MKATVYSLEGKVLKQIEVPAFFNLPGRDDLVKRAVLSEETKEKQPKGNFRFAGLETSARYRGRKEDFGTVKNKGIPHLPHEVLPKGQLGKVKRVPHAVKGRRAHPPKPQKNYIEEMNSKEYLRALEAAIAMTSNSDLVAKRMRLKFDIALPAILDNKFESLSKTKDVLNVFVALKLDKFVEKSKRLGSKAPLIVVSDGKILKAASNLAGVDVVRVRDLQVKDLAPGAHPGRLTLFSEAALPELLRRFEA